jgi:hypothetical protein
MARAIPARHMGSMTLTALEQRAMVVSPFRRRARQCSKQSSPACTQVPAASMRAPYFFEPPSLP